MISEDVFARYAAMRVPRYTSYPTSPNFSAEVDSTQYRLWLRSLDQRSSLSIYLHIPFCRQMCWYCGCHTSVTRRQAPVSRYVESVVNEIRMVASVLQTRPKIGHLHWGGGSPTLLTTNDVERISEALADAFVLDPVAENAVEVDPRTLSEPLARAFGRAGINRASIGVQSFDPQVQVAINRIQSVTTTADAVQLLRDCGIPGINFDLIYGLPFQTVESCLDTVEKALKLQPDRLSVFGYAHVPSFKAHQRKIDEAALPGPEERAKQAETIAFSLTAAGYRQIGLDHFALPGDSLALTAEHGQLHRNFQGYTTDRSSVLLGFGASAIGRLPQGFVQNATKIPDYERRIAEVRFATVRGCRVNEHDSRRAAIIEQLMCNYRARVGSVDAPLGELEADGLIRRSGEWVVVTDEGRPLVRAVAAAFDSYLPSSAATHVAAV
jgi:oxygen-independent coproporphyrinogen-3 oxidase